MVGKYVDLTESYKSLSEALIHAGIHTRSKVNIHYVDSEEVERDGVDCLATMDAILVPGGFGKRGIEGKIKAIRYARENERAVPRHLPRHAARGHRIRAPHGRPRRCQQHRIRRRHAASRWSRSSPNGRTATARSRSATASSDLGGTMRLGAQPCEVVPGSLAHQIYGATAVAERHRHRYEVNNHYLPRLEAAGLVVGARATSETAGDLCEMMELPQHPWFVGVPIPPGIHVATRARGHPLFIAFVRAAQEQQRRARVMAPPTRSPSSSRRSEGASR